MIPTARAAQLTMNRGASAACGRDVSLPTSGIRICRQSRRGTEAARRYRVPLHRQTGDVVVGQGRRLCTRNGLETAWDYALSAGRVNRGRVIVEEMVQFDFEITLLTVRNARDGAIHTHFCAPWSDIARFRGIMSKAGSHSRCRSPRRAQTIAGRITAELGGRGLVRRGVVRAR